MAQRKPKQASAAPASLKTPMTFSGGSTGAIDTSTLPKPQLEQWSGWASVKQPKGGR